ncbi:hypothetical protein [Anoxynatronum buryatiense]|uniref:Uncharacterized protein n=1 Tax=Anoxynatronum buryatiense TaxID=489973 RepID=A0AA45WTV5_9CLOT|nr:hypothetical protein [Anoxynatronum buryatiense]SMP44126.1 hypothetical protein SAMN06296020_102131 [Anoxynatronum buryatiense]
MYQGIILEGISGSGKTEVLQALLQHPSLATLSAASRLILTEHHTQRVLELQEQQGTLQPEDHIALLEGLTAFIEGCATRTLDRGWHEHQLASHDLFFLLERFHLTHVFRFPHMQWEHVKEIDRRLKPLGTTLCLLTVDAETLEKRLFSRQDTCWLQYLKQYGDTPAAIVDSFMKRQAEARRLSQSSCLPVLEINTSEATASTVSQQIISTLCFPAVEKYSNGV